MTTEGQGLLGKVNDSDKQRGILPETAGHTAGGEGGCGEKVKQHKWKIVAAVAVLLVALILGLVLGNKGDNPSPTPTPPGPTPPGPAPIDSGYNLYYAKDSDITTTKNMVSGVLTFNDSYVNNEKFLEKTKRTAENAITLEPNQIPIGANNRYIRDVKFEFSQVDYKVTKVHFTDNNSSRFNIPTDVVGAMGANAQMSTNMAGFTHRNKPFGFEFRSTRSADVINVDTTNSDFIMTDKFMQLDLQVPSQRIYGLGERTREFSLAPGTWTMWSNGRATPYDDGTGGLQTYGVHPFALIQTQQKDEWMGIFFRNANAQSPIITYKDGGNATLTYVTTGGELEMYFFTKGNAKEIIAAYHNLIGRPTLPPLWSLGWQFASYDYETLAKYDEVVKGYNDAGIPFEGIFFDIPYMKDFADFSVDTTAFPNLKTWTEALHANNQKLTLIIDAALAAENIENPYYISANQQKVLLKSTVYPEDNNGWLMQKLWPGKAVFLDFFNQGAIDIWKQGLNDLWDAVPYDGIWLDLNEASGDCNGECGATLPNKTESTMSKLFNKVESLVAAVQDGGDDFTNHTWFRSYDNQTAPSTYNLPFSPGKDILTAQLLSLNATHVDGQTEYNLHSLFGHRECMATHSVFSDSTYNTKTPRAMEGLRTFILSRSTFAGSGHYAQHWLGDNHRDWKNMQWSIAGVMNFNMFGIPMVGPDTCGFYESDQVTNVTEQAELCARWIQLATFYPFARQHHDKTTGDGHGGPALEPYLLNGTAENPTEYTDIAKKAIVERFSYVRHMYTCLFRVNQDGGSCFDPMMYHYPNDDVHFAQNNTEHTFLVGDALKVTPILESQPQNLTSYFPNGKWVSMRDYSVIVEAKSATGLGEWKELDLAITKEGIHSHLRPGYMVPYQTCGAKQCNTTTDLQDIGELSMIINRDTQGHAKGRLFLNADDTIAEIESHTYEYYEFVLGAKSIKKWNLNSQAVTPAGKALGIKEFVITDADDLASTDFACWADETTNKKTLLNFKADSAKHTLTLSNTDGTPLQPMNIKNIYFGDSTKDLVLCQGIAAPSNAANLDPMYSFKTPPALKTNTETLTLTNTHSQYPDLNLTLAVVQKAGGPNVLRVNWKYSNATPYRTAFEVPTDIIEQMAANDKAVLSDYVAYTAGTNTTAFKLDIVSPANKATILYTLTGDMQLLEYINVINGVAHTYPDSTEEPEGFKGVMGVFEQTSTDLFLKDGVYSLWSRDQPNPEQTTKAPGANLYGTHPFIMAKATDQTWFGQFTNLAAAQDWWIKNDATTGDVSIRTIGAGGVADMYFFVGANPNELTKAYHSIIGTPVVTPQWALGWHQCKWGYSDTKALEDVVGKFISNKLPLETQWSDIDYMADYKDFTIDQMNFKDLGDFVARIQKDNHMKYIPIVDAGVAQRLPSIDNYDAYNAGVSANAFLLAGSDDHPIFTGQVWAVDAAFPDYFAKTAGAYWGQMMTAFHDMVGFNGVWLDMNEASNMLCTGTCYDSQKAAMPVQNNLPYIPTGRDLETKSISLDAVHADGTLELDAHSLYGTMEVHNTHNWFKDTQKERTMIISRSSYAGMGKYGSRWLGDNFSNPQYMAYSVTGVMANNIAGITLAGSDICGFIFNTTAQLCGSWYALGAYYPFSRNHNAWNNAPQEPWQFNSTFSVGTTTIEGVIQNAMYKKLDTIRYLYTQMSIVQRDGGAYFRPLFYDFPNEKGAYADQELNVMLGPSLKLSVQSGAVNQDSTTFYFPTGTWCDIYCNGATATACCVDAAAGGKTQAFQTKYAFQTYLHIRGGHIVPMQDAVDLAKHPYNATQEVKETASLTFEEDPLGAGPDPYVVNMTTFYLQQNQTDFLILPSCNASKCVASGDFINDDGYTLDLTQRNTYEFTYEHDVAATPASPTTMTITVKVSGLGTMINANDLLNKIKIYSATSFMMDSPTYSVVVNYTAASKKTAQPLGNAKWNDRGDKLEVVAANVNAHPDYAVDLTVVDTIVFTKAA